MTSDPAGGPGHGRAPGRRRAAVVVAALVAAALAGTAAPAAAGPARSPWASTSRVSTGQAGAQPDGASWANGLSADGRYAVFSSTATNLVPGDTNGQTDVFVRDTWTGRVERISLAEDGSQGAAGSYDGAISGNGRYVVFTSTAALAAGDTNGAEDLYVRDRWTGRTERLTTGDPTRDQTDRNSYRASVSLDGRYVAFASTRTDLVPEGTPGLANIFVTDRWNGTTRLISVGANGGPADRPSAEPVISADGSTVGFISKATNLLPPDGTGAPAAAPQSTAPQDGTPRATPQPAVAQPAFAQPSAAEAAAEDAVPDHRPGVPSGAGRSASGPGAAQGAGPDAAPPTAARADILKPRQYPFYLHDLRTGRTSGGSIGTDGLLHGAAGGSLSPDARYALFSLPVTDPAQPEGGLGWHFQVFVRDLRQGTVRPIGTGLGGAALTGSSYDAVMAAGNRWVYFTSSADNLVADDTNLVEDVFRHDLWTGRTERVSVSSDGAQSAGSSYLPFIDALGTTVLFTADDGTLVAPDTNGASDAFARRLPLP
ncbi:hypothetical protein [Kitasatospora sp. NPDC090091]|uniref:TolB family protein n=1 Tax=Kitasatospora sp. NPDC090091 TaxID=3364081 RepID=UPI00381D4F44